MRSIVIPNLITASSIELCLQELTKREWEVLLLLANDLLNQEIADQLHITSKSVKTYRTRIGSKLCITGRDHLARFARLNKELLYNQYSSVE